MQFLGVKSASRKYLSEHCFHDELIVDLGCIEVYIEDVTVNSVAAPAAPASLTAVTVQPRH